MPSPRHESKGETDPSHLLAQRPKVGGQTLTGGNHYLAAEPRISLARYRDQYLPQLAALTPSFQPEESWT